MTKAANSGQVTVGSIPVVFGLQDLPLDLLDANPLNPRRTMDDRGLEELAASIKQTGITQPLLVRPWMPDEGLVEQRYQIVCGHRRSEAATMAGLDTVPCNVRDLTDEEAAEMAFVDNLQRVDVEALEEAEALGALLERHGSVAAVAARVGKDVAHVAKRLKLRTLGAWQRDALRGKLITVDHALLLARLGVAEQDEALKWALDPAAGKQMPADKLIETSLKYLKDEGRRRQWEPESVVRLREHIEQSVGRKLSRAPWSLAEFTGIDGDPVCSICPQNTKANASLFGDLDIDEATCADGACFERKRDRFVEIKLAQLEPPAVKLSWKYTSTPPRSARMLPCMCTGKHCEHGKGCQAPTKPLLTQTFKAGQWVEARKGSCANVLAGVTVDWSDDANRGYMDHAKLRRPGEVIQVCVAGGCKAHRKEWEKPKAGAGSAGGGDLKAEAERAEKTRLAALAETKLRVRLASEAIERVKTIPEEVLRELILRRFAFMARDVIAAILPGWEKALKTAKVDSIEFARVVALAWLDVSHLKLWDRAEAKQYRKEFIGELKALGYDASKAWDTPKAAKPAAAKKAPAKKAAKTPAKKAAKKAVRK